MPETTNNTPRLLAAAKEFNIGKETLIDFLSNKGFDMGGFGSPNARLTAVMYSALQSEFQQDKANKRKSDQIALPKGSVLETKMKKEKEEAEAAAKKNNTKDKDDAAPVAEAPKAEPAPETKTEPVRETPKQEPQAAAPATPPPAKEKEKEEPKPKVEQPVVTAPPVAEVPKAPVTPPPAEQEVVKTESPKINGPKVITTIDLDAINRKKAPAKKEPDTPAPQPEAATPAPPAREEKPQPVTPPPAAEKQPEPKPAPVTPAPAATTAPAEKAEKPEIATPKKEEKAEPAQPAPQTEKAAKTETTDTTEKTEKAAPVQDKPVVKKVEEVLQEAKPAAIKEPATIPVKQPVKEENRNTAATDNNSQQTPPPAQDEQTPAVITNIQAEKLTGPKVIGKIELPVQSDRRDNNKNNFSRDEKRKRKRIIVEKKPEPIQSKDFPKEGDRKEGGAPGEHRQQGNRPHDNRGGGHQGGNRPQGDNRNRQGGGNTGGFNRQGQGQGQGGQNQGGGFNRGGGQGGNRQGGGQGQQGGGFNRGGGQGGNRPGGQGNYNRPGQGGNYNRPGHGNRDDKRPVEEKEIDKNEIQNKIKETMAKLGGGGRGKNVKAKHRREKREERASLKAKEGQEDNKLQVTEFVSVSELANLMDVSFAEVISKCMGLGIMVSINQRLDAEVIELVAGEFGYEVEFIGLDAVEETDEEDEVDAPEDLLPRAPIVTIMGHVDHGKTSLLDYIRSANVVAGEAGGITQHIGAYQVTTANGKKITFLDTPGHEAFTAMRARGAKAADIAVIVVAADDAIMPQTKEAISHSQAAGLPMVFAINKIDKDGANPEKIKEQLAGMNLLVEDWGGKYQSQEISAKSGLNIDVLLEKILLEAELLELKANPDREASGSIVEASLDKGRGYVASLLVQNGTLRQGDTIVSGSFYGKIKAMFNERGQKMDIAGPSMPVQVLGLNGAPQAGEKFKMYEDESEAKEVANRRAQIVREQGIRTKKHITLDEIGRRLALGNFKQLNLIIKADFDGSVEALSDSLQKLSTEEIVISIVHKAVGQITESDVLLATASDAIILGFQVRPSSQAGKLAEKENIEIRNYSIIYDAIEEIKSAMEGMLEPKIEKKVVCNVQVRETYKFDKVTVAGCFVLDGKLARNTRINVVRDGIVVFTGELASLKRYKDDVKEVASNMECGLSVRGYSDLRPNDIIEGFEEVEVKRTL
ncbi:translation initiation factor IF-2 [Chitinophaga sp. Mgbs1]|uniref:Translation initiation factor IF-2 n=1 Tax=Chitinophaga solisilvae TaxID=1233460 RepID=A0A433WIU6_9BACT|nr:translation initiation factor IF-2 [Chitinophaga solisilvae]